MQTVIERLLSKIMVEPTTGCWMWLGATNKRGYGHMSVRRTFIDIHRLSYEFYKGLIPLGLQIDHLCRTPSCANPDHLEAVSPSINVLRGNTLPAQQAKQTHCKRGHPLDLLNSYFSKK